MAAEIKPLTSVRGIAAVLVAVYHFHQTADTGVTALNRFIAHGYFWVDLFFVLSGYVMALTYAGMFAQGYSWSAHKDFLMKRIARVYPLYFSVTMLISLYSLAVYGGYGEVHRPAVHLDHPILAHITNLLMIHAWGFGASIGGPTWSISTEWAAYLLFPWLVYLALFARRAGAVVLGCIAAATLGFVATQPETGQTVRNGQFDIYHCMDMMAVLRCLGGFSVGLLAYRLAALPALRFLQQDSVCFAVFIALLAGMASGLDDLWLYPLLPLLVIALAGVQGAAARFFSAQPFYQLGVLSYSIYLLHAHFHVVLGQLELRLPQYMAPNVAAWLAVILTYGMVLGAAVFCYRYIEKPGREALKHLSLSKKLAN